MDDVPHPAAGTSAVRVRRIGGADAAERDDVVASEAPLEIRIAPRTATVLLRTPGDDEDLVRGFLLTEGFISRAADILSIVPDPAAGGTLGGSAITVDLAWPPEGRVADRFLYGSSSCGACGKTSLASLEVKGRVTPPSAPVRRDVLVSLPAKMRAAQAAFGRTGGLHATALFTLDGDLVVLREDVGRHNAFDKAAGHALATGRLPLRDTIALLSGRVSYELVQKAVAAGVPVIAAIGAPSSLAVTLADRFGVTLVGFLRGETANVYTHADRVV